MGTLGNEHAVDALSGNAVLLRRALANGVDLTAEEKARIRAAADAAAEAAGSTEPIAFSAHAIMLDALAAWRSLARNTPDSALPALVDVVPRMLGTIDSIVVEQIAESIDRVQDGQRKQDEAKRALATALLAGEPAAELAGRLGITIASGYVVIVARIAGTPTPEDRPQFANRVAQVSTQLESNPDVLYLFERDGWTLLVSTKPGTESRHREDAAAVVARIAESLGVPVACGGAVASTLEKMPTALEEGKRIASIAGRLARHNQLFWIEDFALEYQLDQPGPANNWLRAVLAPLRGQFHLLQSLDAFVGNNFHRAEAADALHIHRNSLNYRLSRIAALTGYDPTVPADARILAAALTVVQLTVERRASERAKGFQAPPPMPRAERAPR